MHARLSTLLIAALAVAAFGGLSATAGARQGADDPAGHVRQSHGADDPVTDVRQGQGADDTVGGIPQGQGADAAAGDDSKAAATRRAHRRARHGHHHHRHARHGAAHRRHGHGADDAPNHG